ncbi:hypothetical protein Tco_1260460 [Tanacetum coccineum]
MISDSTLWTTNKVSSICYYPNGTIFNSFGILIDYRDMPYTFSKVNKFTIIGCYDSAWLTAETKFRTVSTGCMVLCSTTEQDSGDNMSYIRSFNPCAYAFVGEENVFKFNGLTDLSATPFKKRIEATVPIVLEWAIGNLNCFVAEATDRYVFQSNSTCVSSTRESGGYHCVCKEGYEGNPYLAHGYQGTIKW